MEKLEIDITQLDSTIKVYQTEITNFENMEKELEKAINTLKVSGWMSGASTQYFTKYDTSWKKNMERHILIIKHLHSCLDNAKKEYEALYLKVHTLGDNI